MKKSFLKPTFIITAGVILVLVFLMNPSGGSTESTDVRIPETSPDIRVIFPVASQLVMNPLMIKGEAKGTWYFEGSFEAKLVDNASHLIVSGPITNAPGTEWMTEDFVPFEGSLTFTKPSASSGYLILSKNNPSGLPENDESIMIPVKF